VGVLGIVLLAASAASAQKVTRPRAPFVHVYSRAGDVASNYVEPAIEVGEEAYVFVVAIDLDGRVQVLHPEFAGLSVRIREHRELQLKNFFAGYDRREGRTYSGSASYSGYNGGYADDDTRGVVIALASRAPFNFGPIYSGNDWNLAAIRSLIDGRSATVAARNLAHYIGAKGEQIGQDFMRFAGGRDSRYAYVPDAFFSECDLSYAYGLGGNAVSVNRQRTLDRIAYLQSKGQNISVVGYDVCGRPIIAYGRVGSGTPRIPTGRVPHGFPRDTTVFPKTQGIPATGAFPRARSAGTIPSAPRTSASEERPAELRVIYGEPGRRAEPQPQSAEPVYAQPRMPRVEQTPAPSQAPAAPRNEPRVINEPAQGSFGSSRRREEAPAPQPRIIEPPTPVQREQPVQRSEPVQREVPPPRSEPAPRAQPAQPPTTTHTLPKPPPSRSRS
jgi:hypothetical protein